MQIVKIHQIILVAIVISISSYFRLRGVTQNGILGSDTFQYLDIALMWRDGHFVLNNDLKEYRQFFRPFFYALNVFSFYLFGVNDYAMRLLLGIFESFNIFLVFLIGQLYFRNFIFALSLAVAYSCVPSAILLSQIELPHTYSVSFLLLAFIFLLITLDKQKKGSRNQNITVLLSGIFAGTAAVTHGSTTFIGPIFIALIGLNLLLNRETNLIKTIFKGIKQAALFTVGFFVHYLFWGAIVGYGYMISAIKSETSNDSGPELDHFSLFMTYLTDGPRLSLSPLVQYLFYCSLFVIAIKFLISKKSSVAELSPVLIFFFFCGLFSLVFENVFYARLFLPMNIFVLLVVFKGFQITVAKFPNLAQIVASVVFTGYLAFQTILTNYNAIAIKYHGQDKGGPRYVYDYIGSKVTDESKLLVAPYLQWMHRPQYKAPVYFGKNALYLMECGDTTLEQFIVDNKIQYIFISTGIDPTIAESPQSRYKNLGRCSGMNKGNYSLEQDQKFLENFLRLQGAKVISGNNVEGTLYSLSSSK